MDQLKHKILFVVQLPPPTHGVSIMSQYAINNPYWENRYRIKTLPLTFGQKLDDLGKITFGKLIGMAKFFIRLIYTLAFYRPSLVYFTIMPTGKIFYRDLFFTVVMKLFVKKIIFHLHGNGINSEIQKSKLIKWLYKKTFQGVRVICLSDSLVSDVKGICGSTPFILSNGIEFKDTVKYHTQNEIPEIIFLSNLFKAKGIEIFLNSLVLLHNNNISFRAKVIGDSADYSIEQAKEFCRQSGLTNKVEILGPKFGKEKMEILSKADIYALPSYNECFPLTILEAMKSGLSIIATRVGAIPDIIADNEEGLLINVDDLQDLSEKLHLLITDSELRSRLKYNAQRKFANSYTIDHFHTGLANIFEKTLLSTTTLQTK